ncbi:MAG: transcriptional repressor, partial [Phycisphaerales bacterium]
PHFVCNDCGDIRCLDDDAVSIRLQPSRLERRATVTAREIVLRGTCQRCNDNP